MSNVVGFRRAFRSENPRNVKGTMWAVSSWIFTVECLSSQDYWVFPMTSQVNKERVNDTAKLVMHRLIARELGRDPSLVERARVSLDRSAAHHQGYSFIQDWNEVLD